MTAGAAAAAATGAAAAAAVVVVLVPPEVLPVESLRDRDGRLSKMLPAPMEEDMEGENDDVLGDSVQTRALLPSILLRAGLAYAPLSATEGDVAEKENDGE